MAANHSASDGTDARRRSPGRLVLLASMESAGSGWLYNMTNDLLVAAGNDDVRDLRDSFALHDILRWHNCNVHDLVPSKWARLESVLDTGQTFVVKSHRAPTPLVRELCQSDQLRTIYVYRDPRDVVVSAFQRGRNLRRDGNYRSFGRLLTIDVAIVWMRFKQLRIFERWTTVPETLLIRYEDLTSDALAALRRICEHLEVEVGDEVLEQTADRYRGAKSGQQTGTHFRGGGSRRESLSSAQIRRCNWAFRDALAEMGYTEP